MKYLFFAIVLLIYAMPLQAQEDKEIITVVDAFFVAMEAKDTVALDSLMHPLSMIFSTLTKDGKPRVEPLRKASFLGFMRRAIDKKYIYDERLWTYEISKEDNLATVWTEYTMFTGKEMKLTHCGVNIFTLVRMPEGNWVISNISDTRRKDNCIEEQSIEKNETLVHKLMNDWHHAAEVADEDVFFGSMTKEAIYLGTDASERWLRDELREWSKTYFDRDTAWAFTPTKRQVYFSNNQRTAWFEESLDTWMGTCRGSGVLIKTAEGWKISHYDLSIMIPNQLVSDFLTLVEMGGLPKRFKKNRK